MRPLLSINDLNSHPHAKPKSCSNHHLGRRDWHGSHHVRGRIVRPVVKVLLRHPRREQEVPGPSTVRQLLENLAILPESVLVIRESELLLSTDRLEDADEIEIRPVISGG